VQILDPAEKLTKNWLLKQCELILRCGHMRRITQTSDLSLA